jgi:uncharacterized protein (TIGR03435 family)
VIRREIYIHLMKHGVLAATVMLAGAMHAAAQNFPMPLTTGDSSAAIDAKVKLPEYDVASIKENKSGTNRMEWRSTDDGFSATNLHMKSLIASAYGVNEELVSGGPGWLNSSGFDINAKVAGEDMAALKNLSGKQRAAMLQPLLQDRCKLKAHVATRMLPIFNLEVSRAGTKLKQSNAPKFDKAEARDHPDIKYSGTTMSGPGYFTAYGISMSQLADNLTYVVDHTVVDKTGLSGTYDIQLKFARGEDTASSKPDNGADPAPSIFTALEEQLGLKLQSTKGPVDTLVIDSIEKPSEN